MASFSAVLRVAGQSFPVLHCSFGVEQATHQRGRVSTKVRYGPVQLTLDVPEGDLLPGWANEPHKRQPAQVFFRDSAGGSVVETLALKAAYCVRYHEQFVHGDAQGGAYQCYLTLSDPDGWTLAAGGPATAFVAPAAREHGLPGAAASVAAMAGQQIGGRAIAAALGSLNVSPHLGPPVPVPSPDHQQLHLTAAEWQGLTAGRWDRRNNKKFFKKYRSTEFSVEGDPFTYRVDDKGKVVAVYDALKSYNVIGARKNMSGIPLTVSGQPTFAGTPHMMPVTGTQKNVVEITMGGNRAADFKAANEAAELTSLIASQGRKSNQAPKGYTWHHRHDFKSTPPPYGSCTMELVKQRAHNRTFVHLGACDECNQALGRKQYK